MIRVIEVELDDKTGDVRTVLRPPVLSAPSYATILLDVIRDLARMVSNETGAQEAAVYHAIVVELGRAIEETPVEPEQPRMLQ